MSANESNSADALCGLRISPYQIADVYPGLNLDGGVDLKRLGCVMLDLNPLEIVRYVPDGEADLYTSADEHFSYVAGAVGENDPHVTLKFGLLKPASEWRLQIDRALGGWSPEPVIVSEVSCFESPPVETESWHCIVGKLVLTRNLLEGNARLNQLPHIDMHPTYQPHITLAFIKSNPILRSKWIDCLAERFTGAELAVMSELNYGK